MGPCFDFRKGKAIGKSIMQPESFDEYVYLLLIK